MIGLFFLQSIIISSMPVSGDLENWVCLCWEALPGTRSCGSGMNYRCDELRLCDLLYCTGKSGWQINLSALWYSQQQLQPWLQWPRCPLLLLKLAWSALLDCHCLDEPEISSSLRMDSQDISCSGNTQAHPCPFPWMRWLSLEPADNGDGLDCMNC